MSQINIDVYEQITDMVTVSLGAQDELTLTGEVRVPRLGTASSASMIRNFEQRKLGDIVDSFNATIVEHSHAGSVPNIVKSRGACGPS